MDMPKSEFNSEAIFGNVADIQQGYIIGQGKEKGLYVKMQHASPDKFLLQEVLHFELCLHKKEKRPGQCLNGLSSCNGLDSSIALSMVCFSTFCLWMYASISSSYAISCFHAYTK